MKRIFTTPLVPLALLMAALVLMLVWYREYTEPQRRAREIWLAHERVIADVAMEKPGNLTEYQDAYYFFHDLTGVTIPSSYSSYLGPMPSKASGTALATLQHWYAKNKRRLYWDEERGKVRLARE